MRFCVLTLIAAFAAGEFAYSQQRMPRRQGSPTRRQAGNTRDKNSEDVLPNFIGILKIIDKKFFFLEAEDGNTLKFNVGKKTTFFDGDKKIKLTDLKVGDPVAVEAQFDPEHTFDAVNVRIDKKKPEVPAQDSGPVKFSN